MTPQLGSVVLVPVASPQTVAAVHDYVKAWQNAEINIAKAKVKYDDHKQLTKSEKVWLHSYDKHNYADYFRTHSIGRVHGQEVFMNWNGENRNKMNTNTLICQNTMSKMVSPIAMGTMYFVAW